MPAAAIRYGPSTSGRTSEGNTQRGRRGAAARGAAAGPEEWLRLPRRRSGLHAVAAATTDVRLTPLAVGFAPVGSGRAWRDDEERAAEREEEQRRGDSLCENLRAGRHGFPPLCVGHTDRGCGWLLPMGLKDSHGRMPLPFMAGSPWVRREHRPGAGPTSRTVFAALDRTLSGARLCGLCVCRGRGGSQERPVTPNSERSGARELPSWRAAA